MRFLLPFLVFFIAVFPAHAFPFTGGVAVEKQTAGMTAYDFIDSMGVCSHLGRTSAESYANVKAAMQYLGIKYVRYDLDDGSAADVISTSLYNDAGIKSVGLFTSMTNYDTSKAFVNATPEKFLALEGPNEVYLKPVNYGGWAKYEAERKAMGAIWNDYAGDFTIYGSSLGTSTVEGLPNLYSEFSGHFNNLHAYPASYGGISGRLTYQQPLMPNKPFVITEQGSHTKTKTGDSTGTLIAVTPLVQAKYLLNAFFFAKILGVEKTFIYELIDANDEEIMTSLENHFGVFQYDMTPKLSADVIHRLTTLLADVDFSGAVEKNIDVSSSATIRTLQIHKSDGSVWLGLSKQSSLWNSTIGQEIVNQNTLATITTQKRSCVIAHDVITNESVSIGCGYTFDVSVPDYFIVLKINEVS